MFIKTHLNKKPFVRLVIGLNEVLPIFTNAVLKGNCKCPAVGGGEGSLAGGHKVFFLSHSSNQWLRFVQGSPVSLLSGNNIVLKKL
jgi:hypothetical protein